MLTREAHLLWWGRRSAEDCLRVVDRAENVEFELVNCWGTFHFSAKISALPSWWESSEISNAIRSRGTWPVLRQSVETLDGRVVRVHWGWSLAFFERRSADGGTRATSGILSRALLVVESEGAAESGGWVLMFLFWWVSATFSWAVSFLNLVYSRWRRPLASFAAASQVLIKWATG